MLFGLLFFGCGDGCGADPDEAPRAEPEEEEAAAEPLRDQVVAVARVLRFNEHHFDLRHWRSMAMDQGLLDGSIEPVHLVGQMPTALFRFFFEELLEDQASALRWDGHLDVAIWRPEEEGGPWRWAASMPRAEGQDLADSTDWTGEGFYRTSDEEGAEVVPVFRRPSGDGDEETVYYVAEIDAVPAMGGSYDGRSITVSNFPEGAARLGEAVGLTGDSGSGHAELFVWPRRWGIADRYLEAAEMMEQQISLQGHDLMPARIGLLQLQTQIYRALGNPRAWPEVARLTMATDRGGQDEQGRTVGRRAEITIDLPSDQGTLFPALWSAMRESNLRSGPRASDAVAKVGLVLRPREMSTLAEAVLPRHWLQLMSVRGAGTRDLLIEDFEQILLHNRGPTTVAFYPSTVPMGMTGEVFIGWRAMDRDELNNVSRRFHRRFMRDYWMPLFDSGQFARRESIEGTLGGDEVTFHTKTFNLGHGFGEAGVCWTVRGQEYLSYYGVRPCERLQEVADFPEETGSGPAAGYNGSLHGLIDKLYILPGESMHDIFGELDVSIGVSRYSQGRLSVRTAFGNPAEIAKIAEAIPHLVRYWGPSAAFDPSMMMLELGLDQATYQEPGLMTLGVPGMGGMLPASFLLGMPFSFPPTPPSMFREIYFNPEGSGPGHSHHGHSH